jgi:acyl-coenzyme A thioesterase PaaI-like protein
MNLFLEPSGLPYNERAKQALSIFIWNSQANDTWSREICDNSETCEDHALIKDKDTEFVYCLKPTMKLANYYGAIHGGAVGTIVDVFTSMAIMAFEDPIGLSVSVTMNVDYFKSIDLKKNKKMFIKTKINKFGRRLAFCACDIYDEKMNLCYTANHTKMRMDLNKMKAKL